MPPRRALLRNIRASFRLVCMCYKQPRTKEKNFFLYKKVGVELKEYLGNVNRAVPKFRLLWEGIDDILGQFTEACFVYGNCISSNVSSDIDFKRNCQLVAKGSFISLGYLTAAFAQPVSMLTDQVEKYASAFVLKADLIEKMWCHLVIKFMPDMTRRTDDTVTMLTGRKSSVLTAHRPHSSKQTSVQSL
ncbi:uncharacterized protein LOC111265357 isoform X2 [Varroa jacobsoni]|uniref:uncharacterized protein LOC111265357 isoform X2 n=2 Tax=Varroa jacobsoni TaxID=62625 RepID=UPI000BF9B8EC|nr:uncharacterized protein LOC111265357 isoform X2 [Varroa jacobsoni]